MMQDFPSQLCDSADQYEPIDPQQAHILRFWLGDDYRLSDSQIAQQQAKVWWKKNPVIDNYITVEFADIYQQCCQATLAHWRNTPLGSLCLVIILDQFSRHIFRDNIQAYAQDKIAQQLSYDCINNQFDKSLRPIARSVLYLPLEHSEDLKLQNLSVKYFKQLRETAKSEDYKVFNNYYQQAIRHQQVIEQFGRFPHRNKILNRTSSAAELAFLKQPGSRF